MRGHVQQRGKNSWRIKVFVGRDAAGVRRYVERTVRGTRRDAEREVARVVVEVDEGRHVAAAPISFGELLDQWLDLKRRMVEPKTIESYEWVVKRYVRPALTDRRVASLRPMDLDALYSDLHGRDLSPRTVRICHTVLRQSLEQARRWGLIARNPAVDATPPPQRCREIEPPTVEQVQALLVVSVAEPPADGGDRHAGAAEDGRDEMAQVVQAHLIETHARPEAGEAVGAHVWPPGPTLGAAEQQRVIGKPLT